MQTTANITRFITGNSSRSGFADLKSLFSSKEAFQHIILNGLAQADNSKKLFIQLANSFTSFAEQAFIHRNINALEESSSVLINLPLLKAQQVGLYYQAIAKYRGGEKDLARAQVEKVADNATLLYRARAIQTLGNFHQVEGNFDEALRFGFEAIRMALSQGMDGASAALRAELNIAVTLSDFGDHHRSLSKLESLWPLVQLLAKQNPFYLHIYHNALAVELSEVGRFDEAQAASELAIASPFISAYPEWLATREEIAQKRDSKWSNLPALPEPLSATELNSVSNRDSQTGTDSKIEAEAEPQAEPVRVIKYQRAVIFNFSIRKYNFQIPSDSIPAKSAAVNLESAQSILERLGESVRPRSPPCFS